MENATSSGSKEVKEVENDRPDTFHASDLCCSCRSSQVVRHYKGTESNHPQGLCETQKMGEETMNDRVAI